MSDSSLEVMSEGSPTVVWYNRFVVTINPGKFGYPFAKAIPRKKSTRDRITIDERVSILWLLAHDWSEERIAAQMNRARSTISLFRKQLFADPTIIARLPLVDVKGKRKFQCRLCTAMRPTRIGCLRHVMSHVLPLEVARDYPLGDLEKNIL